VSRSDRFDLYQRRHAWIGFPLGVFYKMFDDRAFYLASLITYYAFVSLFPLLLLFLSISGFVLQSDPHLRQQLINAAFSNFPDIGPRLEKNISGFKGSSGAIIVGVIGTLYGALGAMQSAQYAFNTMYAVPRNKQPNPIRSRIRSLGLLVLLGTGVLVATGVAILVSTRSGVSRDLGSGLRVLGYALSVVLNFGLFTAAFKLLTTEDLRARDVYTGGAIAAVLWEVLQVFGTRYIVHEASHGSAFYGIFGVVLAALAWLYLQALVIVVSAEINVVLHRHLWPRSLLTPFTDRVRLTEADMAAYGSYAEAQRFKGFEEVTATFRPDGETPP
jgi:membrane protein